MSTYIQPMPSMASGPEAAPHIAECAASADEIHAMSANVGEAAKPSQLDASCIRRISARRIPAIVNVFIRDSSTDFVFCGRCRNEHECIVGGRGV
jgi:hypothetical protein